MKEINFHFDHLVIFLPNMKLEEHLTKELWTPADKLKSVHENQGTRGHYFLFYNTFIEFLYLEDSSKVVSNEKRFGSEYLNRWKNDNNHCPFGIGITLTPFDSLTNRDKFQVYKSIDAPKNEFYLMSKGNSTISKPMIYASVPERAYKGFESLDDVDERVEDFKRNDLKNYLTHPSGVKKLTRIILTIPNEDQASLNVEILSSLKNITIENGEKYQLTLIFDNERQSKKEEIKKSINLVIRY